MWQVVFAHISVESRVVNPDVNGLLDGSGDAIPVSIRVGTQRSDNINQRAERSLLNERIREVNITLDWLKHDIYMYESRLLAIITQEHMVECKEFIKGHREQRHKSVMERQEKKYLKLWDQKYNSSNGTGGHSNQDKNSKTNTKCWVVNLSSQPLSLAQETGLAHGPNFTVTPRPTLSRIHNSSGGGMPKP